MEEKRKIPEVVMDILRDYPTVSGGEKTLLDYIDEIMGAYAEMEKTFYELSEWQHNMENDMNEMRIVIKQLKEKENEE